MNVQAKAQAMEALREKIKSVMQHPLWIKDAQLVFGRGSLEAPLLILGEAPGAHEDKTGEVFVGASGKLLTKHLEILGFKEKDYYICNVLKFRPPNNRKPTAEEVEFCRPFLEEQIRILQPEYILTLGRSALGFFEEKEVKLSEERSKIRVYSKFPDIQVFPTYHPSYVMQFRKHLPLFVEDLKQLKSILASSKNDSGNPQS